MVAAAERFSSISEAELGRRGVSAGTGFGTNPGLRIRGKIFAMLVRGELVVKLPKDRVTELSEGGVGRMFDAGKGRPMKEWLAVPVRQGRRWDGLVDEARTFVGGSERRSR
jgi:hypothetical protein